MKRIYCVLLGFFLVTGYAAAVNMPSAPSYGVSASKTIPSSGYKKTTTNTYSKTNNIQTSFESNVGSAKTKIDSLAKQALKAAENHDNETLNVYVNKMREAGAEGFSNPQVLQKQTPHCPPIKIKVNGKQLSGSKCVMMAYLYKGKQYDVGYCK